MDSFDTTKDPSRENTCCICGSPTYSFVFIDVCMDCTELEQAFRRLTERSPKASRKWLKFQLKHLTKCTKRV